MVSEGHAESYNRTLGIQQFQPDTSRNTSKSSVISEIENGSSAMHRTGLVLAVPLSDTAMQLIGNAIRPGTKTKYESIRRKWIAYCSRHGYELIANTNTYVNFVATEFDRSLKYETIRGYSAALKPYLGEVDLEVVKQAMKGIHNARPSKARYAAIWDINLVLSYIGCMIINNFMDRSQKLSTLLMILSGNRVNMLSHLKLTNMFLSTSECTFVFDDVLKHTRPGFNDKPITFRAYPDDVSLCPVTNIQSYLDTRLTRSDDPELFITTTQPYHKAHPDTIARWIKDTLHNSGIDTGTYSAHSCRAASTSAASQIGVSLTTIVKSASWSGVSTFKKYYLKDIVKVYNLSDENFGVELLKQNSI